MKTGVLDAALVKAGRLTDKKGLNFWDMDTGEFSLSANSTINGNKASSLATQTQVQKLATDAQTAAKAYADSVGASTLNSARNDATAKADTALSGAKTYAETIMAYGSNLVRNPNGNPDHDLDRLGAAKLTKTMPAAHPEGITSAIRLGNVRDTYFGWALDSFRGHTFRLSGWAYRKAGSATSSFGIIWTDAGNGNHWQTIARAAADASGWTYVSGSYTVPSNAKTARLWMQVDRNVAAASDADWYWTGLQCTDETAARSYVDTFEGELTQTYIFNKLTNNGQKQGLYLSNGLLYINATYMRTGVITGKRSYWNLDTGQFVMTDANGNETVHLDGDGADNLLTGTFRTARTGNRVQISPSFKQTEISGTDSLEGAGIQFFHGTGSYQHPYIAVESTTQQEGEVSALTFNGGRRAEHDPGAFARIGERKADDNTTKVGTVFLAAENDYDSTDPSSRRAYLSLWSPKTGGTTATLAARDPNGLVGIQADIKQRIPASRRLPRRPHRPSHLPGSLVGKRTQRRHEIQPIHLHIPRTREIRLIQGGRHRRPPRRRLGADMEHRIRLHGKRLAHMGIHRAGAGRNQRHLTLELQHQHRRRLQPLHQRKQQQPIQRHQNLLPQHHRIPQKIGDTMQITTINGQPTLLIDRPLTTADTTPPAEVTDGMTTIATTPPTPYMRHDAIPLAAIASWRILLGIETDTEAVAAILHVRSNGEPDPDPDTGEPQDKRLQRHRKRHQRSHHHSARRQHTRRSAHRRPQQNARTTRPPTPTIRRHNHRIRRRNGHPDDHRAAGRRRINGTRQPPRRPRRRHRQRNRPIHRLTHPHRQRKGTRLMDNKNLYPAMIGKLREMIADSTIQIAALQAQIDILAKENQRLTDQLNKDDNGNA